MQKTRTISLLFIIFGLLILFDLLILPINVKQINSKKEINSLEINQKILLQGKVIKETKSSVTLSNNLSFNYSHNNTLLNNIIIASGFVDEYYSNKTIKITKIEIKK